jgi:cobalamin synthase
VPVSPGLTGRLADWFDACANNDDAPRLHELVDAERIGMFGAATIGLAFVAGGFTTGAMLLAGKAAATVTAFLAVPEDDRQGREFIDSGQVLIYAAEREVRQR